jgi:hypothetical protein
MTDETVKPETVSRSLFCTSFLRISGALYLNLFEQPVKIEFFL